jgi:hypothetical protein
LVFASRNLKLTGYTAVGRAAEHLQLTLEDELGHIQRSIWWQGAGYPLPEGKFDLAYSVRASTYRGQREVQLEWIDYRLLEEALSMSEKKQPIEVIDFRQESDPIAKLNELIKQEAILLWAEAGAKTPITSQDRNSLSPAQTLAIWTIPPSPIELQAALRLVKPQKVILFGLNPGMDEPDRFLKQLVGQSKRYLNAEEGLASLSGLVTATAQTVQTVKVGLEWLNDHGYIRLISIEGNDVHIEKGDGRKIGAASKTSARLNALLAESAAFRRYYLSAQADRLTRLEE